MKKLLLTGFEPFLNHPINPTEEIVLRLDGEQIGEYEVKGVLLPVDFEKAPVAILEAVREFAPDAVLSLGLAAGRTEITPERIAINCRDGAADNSGRALVDSQIVENGADGYFSTLPIRMLVDALNEKGYPASISNSAGTYLCNNVMYSVLHELKKKQVNIPAGFVHVPASHELVIDEKKAMPSWSSRDLLEAVKMMIKTLSM
ncbi:pyroglutamyl-peptidase I [Robertmurraya korlensis]|uniref:pyroglutamyl-peptidase I n=1 Tax=Robertmurraya korlensis TaxID=519977 RepID=UPI00203E8527|nr:pyroglutamyl-peptidase I [Robertmurraya korlensis]MCM3602125.1 pyroglutamyl-peptidase I [Robertmurraya korlensis]